MQKKANVDTTSSCLFFIVEFYKNKKQQTKKH